MSYQFPPSLERLVNERMLAGGYQNEDELLLDAMLALEKIERHGSELRDERRHRLAKTKTSPSQPLDREAFKAEARKNLGRSS